MTLPFTQQGGARAGTSYWSAWNMTWPFARISVKAGRIELRDSFLLFARLYTFAPGSVRRLSAYRGLFSRGLRIEHTVAAYPPFVLFWSFGLSELTAALEQGGFHVEPR